jgi:hypothetical protein
MRGNGQDVPTPMPPEAIEGGNGGDVEGERMRVGQPLSVDGDTPDCVGWVLPYETGPVTWWSLPPRDTSSPRRTSIRKEWRSGDARRSRT